MTDTESDFVAVGDWRDPGAGAGAHLLLHDRQGRVLLQLRDGDPGDTAVPWAYPGRWSLFGGGVEPGEALRDAALRELAEETGLVLAPDALSPFARTLSQWGRSRLRLFVYRCGLAGGPERVRLGEGAGFALASEAQLRRLDLIPEFAPILALHFAGR